jgi:NAD+ kinase
LRVAIVIYKPVPRCIELLKDLVNSLRKHEIYVEVYTVDDIINLIKKHNSIRDDVDVVFSIGGDGTFLKAAKLSLLYNNIPVLPYPCGRRNFFYEEFLKTSLSELVESFMSGNYSIELCPVYNACTHTTCEVFINEAAIVNSNLGKVAKYGVKVKSPLVESDFILEGDGILLSTAAGSSGYNLSARGPLISPFTDLLIITPLNTLQLGFPSIVLPRISVIEITILNTSILYVDGDHAGILEKNSSVKVTPGSKYVKIIRFSHSRDLVKTILARRAFFYY